MAIFHTRNPEIPFTQNFEEPRIVDYIKLHFHSLILSLLNLGVLMGVSLTDEEKRAFFCEHISYRKHAVKIAKETTEVILQIKQVEDGAKYKLNLNLGQLNLKFLSNDPQTYSRDFSIISNPIIEYGIIACRQLANFLGIKINRDNSTNQEPLSVSFKKNKHFKDSEVKLNDLLSVGELAINDYRIITQMTEDKFDTPLYMLLSIANEASAHLTVNTERKKFDRPINEIYPAFTSILKLIDHYIFFTFSLINVSDNSLIETVRCSTQFQIDRKVKVGEDNCIVRDIQYTDTYAANVLIESLPNIHNKSL